MKHLLKSIFNGSLLLLTLSPLAAHSNECPDLLNHEFKMAHGSKRINLCKSLSGQVLLIVNTASRCGFTPQFEGLEKLYEKYHSQGFSILGFPSNDFQQELQTNEEVASFCRLNYGVTFPMLEKSAVTGENANSLYQNLIKQTGVEPKWNFHKYLVDRSGKVIGNYPSRVAPDNPELISDIKNALAAD